MLLKWANVITIFQGKVQWIIFDIIIHKRDLWIIFYLK